MFALLINASILILAAATFNKAGKTDVAELEQAHAFLAPLLGSAIAPTLFGDRAPVLRPEFDGDGDAVRPDRDGGLPRHPPAALGAAADDAGIAIVPAAVVTIWYGERGHGEAPDPQSGGARVQLPFAIVPLVMFTADRAQDGRSCRAALGDGAGGARRGVIIAAQHQAAVIDATFCRL